jgi:hypothetical protein
VILEKKEDVVEISVQRVVMDKIGNDAAPGY